MSKKLVNIGTNWAVVHEYLTASAIPVEPFLRQMPGHVADICRATSEVLERERARAIVRYALVSSWQEHEWWLAVERALVQQLGHWWHLAEVGRASEKVAFGRDAILALLTRGVGWWFTDPTFGYKAVEAIATSYQLIKKMHFVPLSRGEGRIVVVHLRHLLDPLRDFGSLRFICGFGDGVPVLWKQTLKRTAELAVVAVSPVAVVRQWALGHHAEFSDGRLYINTTPYGETVWAEPNEQGVVLDTARISGERTEGTVPVIRIMRDFQTDCGKCSGQHPLMTAGQLWEHPSAPLNASVFKVYWKSSRIGRFFGRLLRLEARVSREFRARVETETDLVSARREADTTLDEVKDLRARTVRMYPNMDIAQKVQSGNFRGETIFGAVLYTDLPKYTATTGSLTAEETARWMDDAFGVILRFTEQSGGWQYKLLGDCCISVFAPGFNTESQSWGIQECCLTAIETAVQFLRAVRKYGWAPRVGLHAGSAHWREMGHGFEGNGEGLNNAQRLESGASPEGGIAVSREFLQAAYPALELDKAREGDSVAHCWSCIGERTFKGGFTTTVFVMNVVTPPSDAEIAAVRASYTSLPATTAVLPDALLLPASVASKREDD